MFEIGQEVKTCTMNMTVIRTAVVIVAMIWMVQFRFFDFGTLHIIYRQFNFMGLMSEAHKNHKDCE
ncbi:hypothetical protein C0Z22_09295 [Halobacteriovorax sp. DA5]|nr:hypothetical protein C0Z22_09295 [Halobacteriovorax sp. DA5]